MKNKSFELPNEVKEILNTFTKHHYECYLVGGSVRDLILARNVTDYDFTTNATPDKIKELFPKTIDTGIKFGTVTIVKNGTGYEVTTYRSEGKYTNFRRPDDIRFSNSLYEDLKRRDFTINALCYNLNGIIDLFDGISDIENKVIRTVGDPNERFLEDPLRILRAIRFSAQLNFSISPETEDAMQKNKSLLKMISVERINNEITKAYSDNPAKTYQLLRKFEILNALSPKGKDGAILDTLKGDICRIFAYLLYDQQHVKSILKNLKYSNQIINKVSILINGILDQKPYQTEFDLKLYLKEYPFEVLNELFVLKFLIYGNNDDKLFDKIKKITEKGDCYTLSQMRISGDDLKDLGFFGKEIKTILDKLLLHVTAHPSDNNKEQLLKIAKGFVRN